MIDKKQLKAEILAKLDEELIATITAADNARAAATDDQSIAETQYDTLAIEASYLAEGQSRRIAECKEAITKVTASLLPDLNEDSSISLGALVQLDSDETVDHWYFIAPAAGGMKINIGAQQVTVITPASPLGQALLGKYIDDEISFVEGEILGFVTAIC